MSINVLTIGCLSRIWRVDDCSPYESIVTQTYSQNPKWSYNWEEQHISLTGLKVNRFLLIIIYSKAIFMTWIGGDIKQWTINVAYLPSSLWTDILVLSWYLVLQFVHSQLHVLHDIQFCQSFHPEKWKQFAQKFLKSIKG